MGEKLTRFLKIATLCVHEDCLILTLANGQSFIEHQVDDLQGLNNQPLLLIINPSQFLKFQETLHHCHLSLWQQEVLEQLKKKDLIFLSILFLPLLMWEQKNLHVIHFHSQNHVYVHHNNLCLWMALDDGYEL